jgi:hypothetical protein
MQFTKTMEMAGKRIILRLLDWGKCWFETILSAITNQSKDKSSNGFCSPFVGGRNPQNRVFQLMFFVPPPSGIRYVSYATEILGGDRKLYRWQELFLLPPVSLPSSFISIS